MSERRAPEGFRVVTSSELQSLAEATAAVEELPEPTLTLALAARLAEKRRRNRDGIIPPPP